MLFSVEQAFVGREEIRAPLKMPAGEASELRTKLASQEEDYHKSESEMHAEVTDVTV